MAPTKWYFEDFYIGQEIPLGSRVVTEEDIIAFATQFDPQPFHVDHDGAQESIYGGVIASGWHTCSIMMRMVVDGVLNHSSSMGSPGLERVRWLKPVRGGDTLTVVYQTKGLRPSTSKPDRGVVLSVWQASNQRGEVVATVEGMGMYGCRPEGEPYA